MFWAPPIHQSPGDTEGVRGLCLDPHDLAIAKYVAGREKDLAFNRALASRALIRKDPLLRLLDATPIDDSLREKIRHRIAKDFQARPSGR